MLGEDPDSNGQVCLERLAVYTDYPYHREGCEIYAERAFALFLTRLSESIQHFELVGRLHIKPGRSHYRLPKNVRFTPLPYYESVAQPLSAASAMVGSIKRFWRLLDRVDTVWLLGPHPLSICFAAIAALRRKKIVLGVRQNTLSYVRSRYPRKPLIHFAALTLECIYRLLARVYPVVVVGPELARRYSNSKRVHDLTVSLISEADIATGVAPERSFDKNDVRLLSVGRLDAEKNPLALAEVLAKLHEKGRFWHLTVCGEGPLEDELRNSFAKRGLTRYIEFKGYVPIDNGLREEYLRSDIFLHISWTEGLPQVLTEAFAAALPVVATDVGGIAEAVEDAALLVSPGETDTYVAALVKIAEDDQLRTTLIESGIRYAHDHTIESECRKLMEFLAGGP